MDTYTTVKNRILQLLGEKKMSIHKLAMESAVAPSSIKNILYGKSQNPGIVTLKMLCDGFLCNYFRHEDFACCGLAYPIYGLTLSLNSVIIYTTNTKEGFW